MSELNKPEPRPLANETQAETIARLERELAEAKIDQSCLRNLLATIHGDGGHRESAVGVVTATAEAVSKWSDLSADAEALRALAAWGNDLHGNRMDFWNVSGQRVDVRLKPDDLRGSGETLAAAIMDALGKGK